MKAEFLSERGNQLEEFQRKHRTGLVTLVFTDLVDSVALRRQLGDQAGTSLLQAHRQLVRQTLARFPEAEEIETAGDSFLLLFARPSDAVKFALLVQRQTRTLAGERDVRLADRIGIHVGEIVIEEHERGPKPKDVYGTQIDLCARVMGLAEGGQILLTRAVFDSARQALKGEDIEGVQDLSWLNHGPYLLKGIEESVEVCEVGEAGLGVLQAPAGSEKAQRQVRADEEQVLGWRPALGQVVANTKWVLEQKLGEGGFGEVWLGQHQTMKERRVFKFCFRADRVRSLKRETTLFRLLKERIGDHPNIVALREVYFDEPPFYVEMDYVEGRDLKAWCEERGGVGSIPLEVRLEIVAQMADALQAAHHAGVIHRDVKPGNILVSGGAAMECSSPLLLSGPNTGPAGNTPETSPAVPSASRRHAQAALRCAASAEGLPQSKMHVKLTDFGIGQVVSEEYLSGITRAGFTQTILSDSSSSHTGTQIYMAPELLAGKPASTRSDIYSLGVVLFQLLVGDFTRPVTTDWANDVSDPLLREDLQHCFAGNPAERFASAGSLAASVRSLPVRQAELSLRQAEETARNNRRRHLRLARVATAAAAVLLLLGALAAYSVIQRRKARSEQARADQNAEKASAEAERVRTLTTKFFRLLPSGPLAFKDWGPSGDHPVDYEMGVDQSVTHNGQPTAFLKSRVAQTPGFGTYMETFKAESFRGSRVRMSAQVRTENVQNRACVWMRVDGLAQAMLAFDNMEKRPIKGTTDWKEYAIVLDVPKQAEAIAAGLAVAGTGQAWIADVRFQIVSTKTPSTDLVPMMRVLGTSAK